jgi:hypothetical protein
MKLTCVVELNLIWICGIYFVMLMALTLSDQMMPVMCKLINCVFYCQFPTMDPAAYADADDIVRYPSFKTVDEGPMPEVDVKPPCQTQITIFR